MIIYYWNIRVCILSGTCEKNQKLFTMLFMSLYLIRFEYIFGKENRNVIKKPIPAV